MVRGPPRGGPLDRSSFPASRYLRASGRGARHQLERFGDVALASLGVVSRHAVVILGAVGDLGVRLGIRRADEPHGPGPVRVLPIDTEPAARRSTALPRHVDGAVTFRAGEPA